MKKGLETEGRTRKKELSLAKNKIAGLAAHNSGEYLVTGLLAP